MRPRFALALLVLVGLAGASGCGSSGSSTSSGGTTSTTSRSAPDGLTGTSWQLVSYQGPARSSVPAASGAVAGLAFGDADNLTGSTGCNQFGGSYSADGPALVIKLGPMTQMACTGPLLQAQEAALVQLLPQVTGYTATADTLTMTGSDGAVLATWGAGISGLEGTTWKVTGVNNGKGAVESSALTENLTATFGPAGAFSASTGCNGANGHYETTGTDGLAITDLASTLIGCAPDVSALESQYTAALGQVTTYAIAGDQLTLRDATGATQVTLALLP